MSDEEEDGCRKAKSRKEVLCLCRFSLVLATKKKRDEATMETEK